MKMVNIDVRNLGIFGHSSGIALLIALLGIVSSVLRKDSSGVPSAFRPELYHGEGKTHHFFEGWYHKIVRTRIDCSRVNSTALLDGDGHSISMAVVPGVFYDSGNNVTGKNESHAFIFVSINGEKQHYYRFNLETEFRYRRNNFSEVYHDEFYVEIGNNKFSKHGMSLDLVPRSSQIHTKDWNHEKESGLEENDDASISIQGAVEYKSISPWPIPSFLNLGAMGPVGYFLSPFLECYHDVLSFDHTVEGTLIISKHNDTSGKQREGVTTNFFNSECGGDVARVSSRGYVEKDRGESFPSLWIWMQTNSFRKQPQNLGTSLFFSVARIPIMTTYLRMLLPKSIGELEFPGFTAAIWLNGIEDGEDGENGPTNSRGMNSTDTSKSSNKLIPFATWTGAYFEELVVDDECVIATLNSGGISDGLWSFLGSSSAKRDEVADKEMDAVSSVIIHVGRFVRAWIGSWFLNYDSRKLRYRLELVADRRVPHVLLYAPKTTTITNDYNKSLSTSKMEPYVNEALNAKIHVRLFEYYRANDGKEYERLLLDDVGEHAGLEVHRNVQYLVDNLCGNAMSNKFVCL